MIISIEDNKKYNGFLSKIRESICPECDGKTFRKEIKELDPDFPVDENGKKISMRNLSQEDFEYHLDFIKTMSIRQGIIMDWFGEIDRVLANEKKITTRIDKYFKKSVDGSHYVFVICSNCGCSTKKKLSDERYNELCAIVDGKKSENVDNVSESFWCLNCVNRAYLIENNGG